VLLMRVLDDHTAAILVLRSRSIRVSGITEDTTEIKMYQK